MRKVCNIINLKHITYLVWELGVVSSTGSVKPRAEVNASSLYDNSVIEEMILRVVFQDSENDLYCARENALKIFDAYNLFLSEETEAKSFVELGHFNYTHKDWDSVDN